MFHVYSHDFRGGISHRFSGSRYQCIKWCRNDGHGWNFITQIQNQDKVQRRYSK